MLDHPLCGVIRQALHKRDVAGTEVRIVYAGAMDGRAAAEAHIDSLPEPRRSHMRHLHDVIVSAIPEADISM